MAIKNLIFDMGNVLLDVELNDTIEYFAKLSDIPFAELFTLEQQIPEFDLFETGKIGEGAFRQAIKKILAIEHLKDQVFDQGWHSMLGAFPKEKIEYVLELQNQGYRTFLFSNTNALHLAEIKRRLSQDDRWQLFQQAFEKHYYSFEMGLRKPEVDSFLQLIHQEKLNPEETLFVDDNHDNILGAQQAGLKSLHLDMAQGMTIYHTANALNQ